MRVFVTGGAGFIGSHLCDALIHAGHEVVAYDDLSAGSLANLSQLEGKPEFRFVRGDVCDDDAVATAIASCDAVVHLAARIGLKAIVESPLATIRSNARGTEVVLENAARLGKLPVIVASTSEVYGRSTVIPSPEDSPISFGSPTVGRWSYAATKAYDEFLALALYREAGLRATVVRLFNTVGTRQTGRYGMVLPRFVAQAIAGEPLTVYGDGTQTRCFCSVIDVTQALTTMLARIDDVAGDVFNLGNPSELTINALAQRVIENTHSSSRVSFVPFSDAYPAGFEEIMRRVPDISKLRQTIGYEPRVHIDDVIASVVASHQQKVGAR